MRTGAAKRRLDRLPALRAADISRALVSGCGASASVSLCPAAYYGYARQALGDAFIVCGCKPGGTILYPDFICDVTLEPLLRLGLGVAYYPVDDALMPDWKTLALLAADTSAVAVVSVNYFGFPQPMGRWRQFIERSGLAWINDNAHGYGSLSNEVFLDAFGDVSVTSMRKTLPLINGAALRVNRRDLLDGRLPRPPSTASAYLPIGEEFRRVGRSIARVLRIGGKRIGSTPFRTLPDSKETEARFKAMNPLSRCLLKGYERRIVEDAEKRRCCYAAWHSRLADAGLVPVFPTLPVGVSPMVYPCYAKDFSGRQNWLHWAAEKNVDAYPWPSLPAACRQPGSAAVDRWRRLLCFPIHPFILPEDILSR